MSLHNLLPLECLRAGEWADVADVHGETDWVCRMAELGIRAGSRVQMISAGSPCMLQVSGSRICLRGAGCCQILVRPLAQGA